MVCKNARIFAPNYIEALQDTCVGQLLGEKMQLNVYSRILAHQIVQYMLSIYLCLRHLHIWHAYVSVNVLSVHMWVRNPIAVCKCICIFSLFHCLCTQADAMQMHMCKCIGACMFWQPLAFTSANGYVCISFLLRIYRRACLVLSTCMRIHCPPVLLHVAAHAVFYGYEPLHVDPCLWRTKSGVWVCVCVCVYACVCVCAWA